MIDDEHRHLREADSEDALEVADVRRVRVVDEDGDVLAVGLDRRDGLDGGHEVGGRLVGERNDGDVGHLRRLDDAALNKAAEVDDERLALEIRRPILDGLARLERDNASCGKGCLINVGGAGIDVVGEQDGSGMRGVADGVRRLTLPSFDGVEEHGHE